MNKSTLIQRISEKAGLSKKQAESALNAFIDIITETLKQDEKVQIVGFGTFEIKNRAEHPGLNPATLEPITVKASKTPVFKPGKSYKEAF